MNPATIFHRPMSEYAFALDDTRGLERALSDIFEQMRADGTMEEIIGRYLDEPLRYMEGKSDEGEIKS